MTDIGPDELKAILPPDSQLKEEAYLDGLQEIGSLLARFADNGYEAIKWLDEGLSDLSLDLLADHWEKMRPILDKRGGLQDVSDFLESTIRPPVALKFPRAKKMSKTARASIPLSRFSGDDRTLARKIALLDKKFLHLKEPQTVRFSALQKYLRANDSSSFAVERAVDLAELYFSAPSIFQLSDAGGAEVRVFVRGDGERARVEVELPSLESRLLFRQKVRKKNGFNDQGWHWVTVPTKNHSSADGDFIVAEAFIDLRNSTVHGLITEDPDGTNPDPPYGFRFELYDEYGDTFSVFDRTSAVNWARAKKAG